MRFTRLVILITLLCLSYLLPLSARAQIVRDSSLGTMKNQPLVGPNYAITPDLGVIQGPNLFQSFSQFNLNTLSNPTTIETATFSGPPTIGNIITRVTGPQFSVINGKLQSTIPGAHLYFLNPRGVLFGPNASLNVGGSFYVSTADFIRFTDGARFFTNLSQTSTLSSAPILSFGFLGPTVSPVVLQGADLRVTSGQRLGVIAGDVQLAPGALRAPGGRVELAAVASAGEVIPAGTADMPRLILQGFTNYGTTTLINSIVETSGTNGGGGGTVLIRGGQVIADGSGIFSHTPGAISGTPLAVSIQLINNLVLKNNSQIASQVTGAGNGGTINVFADTVEVNTGSAIATSAFAGSGKPGDINMQATRILIAGGAVIGSNVASGSSPGAGEVNVSATESVSIVGELSQLTSSVSGTGIAGKVFVSAPSVELRDGGSIQTFIFGTGRGGPVEIQGDRVLLADGGQIVTNSLGGIGGGAVTINATESITITGNRMSQGGTITSLISTSTAGVQGDAGAVTLAAPTVELSNTGGIQSLTSGQGNAGTITINAARLTVSGGAQIKNTTSVNSSGRGGTINVLASESAVITGQSSPTVPSGFFSDTSGSGDGGSMTISSPMIRIEGGAVVSSSSTQSATGNAGSITLRGPATSAQSLLIDGSSVLTSAQGSGAGGNLEFAAEQVMLKGANISATANSGNAGNIVLTNVKVFTAGDSSLTTEATTGRGGTLAIGSANATKLDLTNTTVSATVKGGSQPGGDIILTAPDIVLTGGAITAETQAAGSAGSILVNAGTLLVQSGALISSSSTGTATGAAGTITVQGLGGNGTLANSMTLQQSQLLTSASGDGAGGSIALHSAALTVQDGSAISATTVGAGKAGDITITDASALTLTGSSVTTEATGGQGGTILINTPAANNLTLTNMTVSATVKGGSQKGGDITIMAPNIGMSGGAVTAETRGTGSGGDITMTAGPSLSLVNQALVSSQSTSLGNAGNITLTSTNTIQMQNSSVIAQASQASGGNITLQAPYLVQLINSTISTSVQGGVQTIGGNIIIDPQFVILQNSKIIAQAVQGQGGNITINSGVFLADPNSVVDASSQFGLSGSVVINSPIQSLSGTLAPLQQAYLSAAGLLRQPCAARMQSGRSSSFIQRGRDGLPAAPGNVLPSPPLRLPPSGALRTSQDLTEPRLRVSRPVVLSPFVCN